MVYGIIGDIHSNLESTIAVIEELNRRGVDKIICTGDIVGYGANPNECCKLVKEIAEYVVMGNHDGGVVGVTELSKFSPDAKQSCMWTRKVISHENIAWLKTLPLYREVHLTLKTNSALIVHSTLSNPCAWGYINNLGDAIKEFEQRDASQEFEICFVGHSHKPIVFMEYKGKYSERIQLNQQLKITNGARYIINPGSVGQPRDGDPRAAFMIYDTDKKIVDTIRIPYDIISAQKKILEAGLSSSLADRLCLGI
ncbi:MAG: metallophosphoesterase family protein [Candidatus Stahlbacteria bacterium]|nr:metallophosphoesterase family protein [Candidatus Stahlbacteria bacterium]